MPSTTEIFVFGGALSSLFLGGWMVVDYIESNSPETWWDFLAPPALFVAALMAIYLFTYLAAIPLIVIYVLIKHAYAVYLVLFSIYYSEAGYGIALDAAGQDMEWVTVLFALTALGIGIYFCYRKMLSEEHSW